MKVSQGKRFAMFGITTAVVLSTIGIINMASAGSASTSSTFVPITPCRLADTRVPTNVGPRTTPLAAQEIVTFQVTGANGKCSIPANATGIASNVTAVNPTSSSYLTVYPADAAQPLASNLNWTASSSPTPNQVTVQLSATGAIKTFNNAGSIDLVIDIVGYYQAAPSILDPLPSGKTITGYAYWGQRSTGTGTSYAYTIPFPADAPASLADAQVNFAKDNNASTADDDASCTGTYQNPTAPAGKVCIYIINNFHSVNVKGYADSILDKKGFCIGWLDDGIAGDMLVTATWAYTAA